MQGRVREKADGVPFQALRGPLRREPTSRGPNLRGGASLDTQVALQALKSALQDLL